ncbi:hypothetical protein GCM10018793_66670 [Streptomyces sulfonofaciens]|uniref:Uncharacterized protein n=1 Tax=Streptomyces sulfonofaciens TaxID=68272 RepID=A0A919GQS8_9ACTN|nr:hypothetical protein GCM10018793_66670 [Streptomyces sulfonofaciens]
MVRKAGLWGGPGPYRSRRLEGTAVRPEGCAHAPDAVTQAGPRTVRAPAGAVRERPRGITAVTGVASEIATHTTSVDISAAEAPEFTRHLSELIERQPICPCGLHYKSADLFVGW